MKVILLGAVLGVGADADRGGLAVVPL